MTNLFEAPAELGVDSEQIASYREKLVGEGKKFKTDEDLARGKWEADQTIIRREKELADIRKELETRISLEDFLTKQKASANIPSSVAPQVPVEPVQSSNEGNQVNVEKLVEDFYTKKQAEAQRAANAQAVRKQLKDVWGDNAVSRLEQVAKDLGVGKEFLQDLAERSPAAFLNTVGARATAQVANVTPPKSNINSAASLTARGTAVRDEIYWDKIKQTDPKMYYSADGYNQRDKDAVAMGEAYFNA